MTITALDFLPMDVEPTQAAHHPEEAQTQSLHAWSQADNAEAITEYIPRRSWKIPTAAAVLAASVAVTAAVFLAWPHTPAPTPRAAPASQAPPPTQAAAPPQPSITSTPPIQVQNPNQRFVAILKAQGWIFSVPDSQIADEGRSVCTNLANGVTFDQQVDRSAAASGIERSHALRFTITAADILCPQYSPSR